MSSLYVVILKCFPLNVLFWFGKRVSRLRSTVRWDPPTPLSLLDAKDSKPGLGFSLRKVNKIEENWSISYLNQEISRFLKWFLHEKLLSSTKIHRAASAASTLSPSWATSSTRRAITCAPAAWRPPKSRRKQRISADFSRFSWISSGFWMFFASFELNWSSMSPFQVPDCGCEHLLVALKLFSFNFKR